MNLREILVPREKVFFQLLEEESRNVLLGAQALNDMILNFEDISEKRKHIEEIEHRGDEIVHSIYERLRTTFITPIDRDEIGQLASLYDDVLDFIDGVAERLRLYEIKTPTEGMKKMARLVLKSVEEINVAFGLIHEIRAPDIEARCIEVDRLENEADSLLHESVAALFKTDDAITIIKLKEVFEFLETITDKCEDVVQELRNIVVEYS
jgi:predicted phosphate transport protein (TIGR00153 family)